MIQALRFLRERAVFLWIVYATPPVAVFAHALAPGVAVFKGQDLGILAGVALAALAVLTWLPYRTTGHRSVRTSLFLAVVGLAWLYQVSRIQLDQTLFNITAFAVPVILVLLALKPTSARELDHAIITLAYGLLAISLLSLVLGRLGWMPDGFAVTDGGGARYAFLTSIGIPGRWGGPFGSVNYASPIGGLLIVLGATRHSWNRILLVAGGILILALGQGRTALFAVVAGLLVVALWSPAVARLQWRLPLRITAIVSSCALAVAYVALLDPTFNGRTPIWSNFLGLLPDNPVFGVGDSGIIAFVVAHTGNPGFVPHVHAHSVFIDGLVRFGIVMAIFTLAIYGLAIYASLVQLRRGDVAPLAVTVFIIVAGVAETLHSWDYWSAYLAVLTWAVLRAGAADSGISDEVERPDDSLSLHGA